MARYIDVEKAMSRIQKRQGMCYRDEEYWGLEVARAFISGLPTEDVAPVRHAKWIHPVNSDLKIWVCSNCGGEERNSFKREFGSYCSYCGAKMDEDYKEC